MKYSIYLIIRKVTAWIMSVLATLGILGGDTQQDADIQRGEENSISDNEMVFPFAFVGILSVSHLCTCHQLVYARRTAFRGENSLA